MDSAQGTAKLYIWRNQLLFLGASRITYRSHSVVSDKLLVSLDGNMTISPANGDPISTRSVLLKAGTSFASLNLDTSAAVVAIYYLPPLSQDHAALESIMTRVSGNMSYAHPERAEAFLGEFLNEIAAGQTHGSLVTARATMVPLICYETVFPGFVADAVATLVPTEAGLDQPGGLMGCVSSGIARNRDKQ